MLSEYFSIEFRIQKGKCSDISVPSTTSKDIISDDIGEDNNVLMLTGLPILLEGHSPPPHALPLFLLRLATEVKWMQELPCFDSICVEIGTYYASIPHKENTEMGKKNADNLKEDEKQIGTNDGKNLNSGEEPLINDVEKKFVQHCLFPAISYLLLPPKEFASDGTVVKLALLSKLYKVFERC